VLAFADVVNFFANEFAGLCGRRFSFALVFSCSFKCLFFWHEIPPASNYATTPHAGEYSETLRGSKLSNYGRSTKTEKNGSLTASETHEYDGTGTNSKLVQIQEEYMAKRSKLNKFARKIGAAVGSADAKAHKYVKAGSVARKELDAISKQLDALKRQLLKTSKRIKTALA